MLKEKRKIPIQFKILIIIYCHARKTSAEWNSRKSKFLFLDGEDINILFENLFTLYNLHRNK